MAINLGWKYGARLPATVYFPLYFADQDWKNPDRSNYMNLLGLYKPHIATVLDLEKSNQLNEVISWAEEATEYSEVIVIIPKVHGITKQIPQTINGKEIRLGYSVPSRYSNTPLMVSEFYNHPVHLLGGSPNKQLEIYRYLPNVMSVDGNIINKVATRYCKYFTENRWVFEENHEIDRPLRAMEKSFINIMAMWRKNAN